MNQATTNSHSETSWNKINKLTYSMSAFQSNQWSQFFYVNYLKRVFIYTRRNKHYSNIMLTMEYG